MTVFFAKAAIFYLDTFMLERVCVCSLTKLISLYFTDCRAVSMTMTGSRTISEPEVMSFYTLEFSECFRACLEHEHCYVVALEPLNYAYWRCRVYQNVGIASLTLIDSGGGRVYAFDCIGKVYF